MPGVLDFKCAPERIDPRRKLLINYAKVIEAFTSRLGLDFFVFENVPGLTQGRHRWRYLHFKRLCKKAVSASGKRSSMLGDSEFLRIVRGS